MLLQEWETVCVAPKFLHRICLATLCAHVTGAFRNCSDWLLYQPHSKAGWFEFVDFARCEVEPIKFDGCQRSTLQKSLALGFLVIRLFSLHEPLRCQDLLDDLDPLDPLGNQYVVTNSVL